METMTGQVQKEHIEKIMGEMTCPKDFECYKSGFSNLCRAKDIGLKSLIMCLEKDGWKCGFSSCLGDICLCRCSLRAYIAGALKK